MKTASLISLSIPTQEMVASELTTTSWRNLVDIRNAIRREHFGNQAQPSGFSREVNRVLKELVVLRRAERRDLPGQKSQFRLLGGPSSPEASCTPRPINGIRPSESHSEVGVEFVHVSL